MNALRRTIVPFALLALASASCTGNGGPVHASSTAPVSPGCGPVESNVSVVFKPGEYRLSSSNVVAALTVDGSAATMDIKNHSGAELGAPSIYVITGDGARVTAKIDAAAPVPNGADSTLQVQFPDSVTVAAIGLIVLKLGDSNYGAFAPVAVSGTCPSP